jgi:hypothetical protein
MAKVARPDLEEAQGACDEHDEAREGAIEAIENFFANLDYSPILAALRTLREKGEQVNEAVADARVDYECYIEDHSERWQDSDKGKQYVEDAQALERCQVDLDIADDLMVTFSIYEHTIVAQVDNAEEILPATRDLPEDIL